MMTLAPVAVELGWLLVSNNSSLRRTPLDVMRAYHAAAVRAGGRVPADGSVVAARSRRRPWAVSGDPAIGLPARGLDATLGDWHAQVDLTWIVGLLLRGWRKGLDAEAGETLASGIIGPRGPRLVVSIGRSTPPRVASDRARLNSVPRDLAEER